ncbi:MAG: YbaN family protein [Bacteroidaceae bacterium]|nr:YbaN family protein [Bacteroidaceae bacterium]
MSWFWNVLGLISFALGFLGLFLPILPTTPLWLLAAFSLMKGSQRLYNWAMSIRSFNEIVTNFQINRTIPLRIKIISITTLWTTIIISSIIVKIWWVVALLLIIATCVTWHILSFKTAK